MRPRDRAQRAENGGQTAIQRVSHHGPKSGDGRIVTGTDQSLLDLALPEAGDIMLHVRSHFQGELPPAGVPPHITLQYPWMPPAQIDERVLAEACSLFAAFPAFDFSLRLGWFGREVLLLVPDDPTPLIRLTEAILRRWPEYPYYGGQYDAIEPHVTLAFGNEASLSALAAEIAGHVPIRARASAVTLNTGEPGHMSIRARFPLSPPRVVDTRAAAAQPQVQGDAIQAHLNTHVCLTPPPPHTPLSASARSGQAPPSHPP